MDQPTYTPTQKIVEASGTLFFKFGDLDSTKPAGSIKIRVETIVHYLAKYSQDIIQQKLNWLSPKCPLPMAPQERTPSSTVVLAETGAVVRRDSGSRARSSFSIRRLIYREVLAMCGKVHSNTEVTDGGAKMKTKASRI